MTDPFYYSEAWRTLRYTALRRDRWACTVCGRSVRKRGESRVDHVKPRRQFPALALVLSNIRTLCASCDNKRHSEKGGRIRPTIDVNGFPGAWRL
jgi:5-methylcytosine-specific restriction endonuclease McrA